MIPRAMESQAGTELNSSTRYSPPIASYCLAASSMSKTSPCSRATSAAGSTSALEPASSNLGLQTRYFSNTGATTDEMAPGDEADSCNKTPHKNKTPNGRIERSYSCRARSTLADKSDLRDRKPSQKPARARALDPRNPENSVQLSRVQRMFTV